MTCPSELELTRAHQLGDDSLADHLAACSRCRESWDGVERAILLARELPVDMPPLAHREEMRTALLATPELPRRRAHWTVRTAWFGAVAAAAAIAIWIGHSPEADAVRVEPPRLAIHATGAADYTTVSSELVRLRDGTITLDVEPLRPGERFRVVVGDGEVEVRGTSFEVTATSDHLIGVRVMRGRVEVRPAGATTMILDPGQSWHVQVAVVTPPPPPPVVPAPVAPPAPPRVIPRPPPRAVVVAPEPPPVRHSPEEVAYNDAWDAMRAADFHAAAVGFARVHALSPAGALADDAAFWQSVALARGGRPAESIVAFRGMIDDYPASPRVGEASAMLGWLLVDAHQLDEAARRFEAAANDPVDTVRASARKGLDALHRH
jgi:hypothetical protein